MSWHCRSCTENTYANEAHFVEPSLLTVSVWNSTNSACHTPLISQVFLRTMRVVQNQLGSGALAEPPDRMEPVAQAGTLGGTRFSVGHGIKPI